MNRKHLFQKLGLAEGASLADRMARYRAYAVDAPPEEAAAMASDLEASGDADAAALATRLRRFAGEEAGDGDGDTDDPHATLARKLGLDAAGSPDEMQEAFARYAATCKSRFAEAVDDPAALGRLAGEINDVLSFEAGEHMDAYAPHFEGLKRLAQGMKRFAGEPDDPATLGQTPDAARQGLSEDPEGDAIIHAFARRRGIDVRRTPRAVILGAMASAGVEQTDIDAKVQAALAVERLKEKRRSNGEHAEQLFNAAVRAGFAKEAKGAFLSMARADISQAEQFVRSLPGAKVLTRLTSNGAPRGSIPSATPQPGLQPDDPDEARVNVEFAERAQQLVERAKGDAQVMSRLTRVAGTNATPGMLLAAAQQLVAKEAPEVVQWARPSASPFERLA